MRKRSGVPEIRGQCLITLHCAALKGSPRPTSQSFCADGAGLSNAPTLGDLPDLVCLSQQLVTGPFKRRFEVLDRYRRQRLANATVDRVGGNSVPPAVPDDGNGGLHLRIGHGARTTSLRDDGFRLPRRI